MRGASKASPIAAAESEPVPEPEPKLVVDPAPRPPVVPQPKPAEEAAPAQPIAVGEPAAGQKKPSLAQQQPPRHQHHHHHLDLEQRHGHAHGHGQGQGQAAPAKEPPAPPAAATTQQPAPPKPAVDAQDEEEDVEGESLQPRSFISPHSPLTKPINEMQTTAEEHALQQPKARTGQSLRDYLVEHTMLEREQHASGAAAPMEPTPKQQSAGAASPVPIVTKEVRR